ncbi:S-adenosyl-L-methionine-dependent methyltransferase [Trichoderma citrinoviride]|uniref:Mitochondrial transcription factor 1 n=1 Tax=Trichoderma citrinoviride TaxID=58853 RepID=A0A2T4BIA5_9HYPO|nr:S-adenosyl-L-methionine-dependent methyltransferase [Trichoderma citrinoviride]PTB69047.1 S-adenosyl-L-methionine-dependent methyltransferase [Trichoderma citrinoviride]
MASRLVSRRTTVAWLLRQPSAPTCARSVATTAKSAEMLKATSPVAQQLLQTGIWNRRGGKRASSAPKAIEPHRVNIVSQGLCDDIINYMGTSLERHRGCDLVDLNPGVGLWSRKLHDFLEPRNHIMMDLDAQLYSPFLEDLISKKNVQLIPKSGIIWKDLVEMIQTKLSHQEVLADKATEPRRNDTLLVTANLSTFPKKAFLGFDSISTMVIYQFMSSIKSSSLFQKYGMVRMLLWVNDDEKRRLIPKSINRRKRGSFEAELACEWVHEVAGQELEAENRHTLRDEWINKESGLNVLARMQAKGLQVPKGRESKTYKESLQSKDLMGKKLAGVHVPVVARPFKKELEELESEFDEEEHIGLLPDRLKALRSRKKYETSHFSMYLEMLQEHERISAMATGDPAAFKEANEAWNEKIDNMKKNQRMEFNVLRDGYHLFRQSPPALLWDRREYEPLTAMPEEFFPNAPTALLDLQPKAMHPLLREIGPNSNHAGDISDIMLRSWWNQTILPAHKAMESLWPGFGDLVSEVPSLRDAQRGGSPLTGHGSLSARSINEGQWIELLEAWMRWPFKPTYGQMLGRMSEDVDDVEEDDVKSGAIAMAP